MRSRFEELRFRLGKFAQREQVATELQSRERQRQFVLRDGKLVFGNRLARERLRLGVACPA